MHCKKHKWVMNDPCPDCKVEDEQRGLHRDLAALACIPAAARLLLVHGSTFEHWDLAREAYDMADAFLLEREQRAAKRATVRDDGEAHDG